MKIMMMVIVVVIITAMIMITALAIFIGLYHVISSVEKIVYQPVNHDNRDHDDEHDDDGESIKVMRRMEIM